MMNGFERRKAQKKEKILRSALELFAQMGFKKVSIHEISHKAGVSPVTIYNHFGSKDGLVRETILLIAREMMDKYRTVIKGKGNFAEKLESVVFDKIGMASQFRGELGQMMVSEDAEYRGFIDQVLMKEAISITLELFKEGREEGYVGKDISDEAIIAYLEVLRTGIAASRQLYADPETYPRIVEELNQLFLYGLIDTGDRKSFEQMKKKTPGRSNR